MLGFIFLNVLLAACSGQQDNSGGPVAWQAGRQADNKQHTTGLYPKEAERMHTRANCMDACYLRSLVFELTGGPVAWQAGRQADKKQHTTGLYSRRAELWEIRTKCLEACDLRSLLFEVPAGGPVAWQAGRNKQHTTGLYATEAELMDTRAKCMDACYLRTLLFELTGGPVAWQAGRQADKKQHTTGLYSRRAELWEIRTKCLEACDLRSSLFEVPERSKPRWEKDLKNYIRGLFGQHGKSHLDDDVRPVDGEIESSNNLMIRDIDVNPYGEEPTREGPNARSGYDEFQGRPDLHQFID